VDAIESDHDIRHRCSEAPKTGKGNWIPANIRPGTDDRRQLIVRSIVLGTFWISLEAGTEFDLARPTLIRTLFLNPDFIQIAYQDSKTGKLLQPFMLAERLE
jgi:hypothetical protein